MAGLYQVGRLAGEAFHLSEEGRRRAEGHDVYVAVNQVFGAPVEYVQLRAEVGQSGFDVVPGDVE